MISVIADCQQYQIVTYQCLLELPHSGSHGPELEYDHDSFSLLRQATMTFT